MNKKQTIGLTLVIIVLALIFFIPPQTIGLKVIGLRTFGVLVISMILLITEVFPVPISCFLSICLMFMFGGVKTFGESLAGFSTTTPFFIITSFAITSAFTKTPLGNRLLANMIKAFGKSTKSMLVVFMVTTATLSAFMANSACAAIFSALAIDFIKLFPSESDQKKVGRAFMIGITIAANLGGTATPAGTSVNILAIGLLDTLAHLKVSFLQWMICGIPIAIVTVTFARIRIVSISISNRRNHME